VYVYVYVCVCVCVCALICIQSLWSHFHKTKSLEARSNPQVKVKEKRPSNCPMKNPPLLFLLELSAQIAHLRVMKTRSLVQGISDYTRAHFKTNNEKELQKILFVLWVIGIFLRWTIVPYSLIKKLFVPMINNGFVIGNCFICQCGTRRKHFAIIYSINLISFLLNRNFLF